MRLAIKSESRDIYNPSTEQNSAPRLWLLIVHFTTTTTVECRSIARHRTVVVDVKIRFHGTVLMALKVLYKHKE